MRKLLLVISLMFCLGATAQQNWVVFNSILNPNVYQIPSDSYANVSTFYHWNCNSAFLNYNHLIRLVIAYPNALDSGTGVPKVYLSQYPNMNGTLMSNAIFTYLGGWECRFPPNTVLPNQAVLRFVIDSIGVRDDTMYWNQPSTRFLDFVAAPYEDAYWDNVNAIYFNTLPVRDVSLGIDTTNPEPVFTLEPEASVYPNPSNGNLNIIGRGRLEIFNSYGQLLHEDIINGKVEVIDLPSGLVIVKLNEEVHKIMIK